METIIKGGKVRNYTKNELAKVIRKIIEKYYNNTEYFYSQFKGNINRKVKSLNLEDLTVSELKEKGLRIAQGVIDDLKRITINNIEKRLSKEIVKESLTTGIDLNEKIDYFKIAAKERVKELLDAQYKDHKRQIAKINRKMNAIMNKKRNK